MPKYDIGNQSPVPIAAITAFYDIKIEQIKLLMDIAHCKRMPCIDLENDTIPDTYDWIWVKRYYLPIVREYRDQLYKEGEGE